MARAVSPLAGRIVPRAIEPRGLRLRDAAGYVGIGETKFMELVKKGRAPKPFKVDNIVCWDRFELDRWIDRESTNQNEYDPYQAVS